jgi:hypothetical protein
MIHVEVSLTKRCFQYLAANADLQHDSQEEVKPHKIECGNREKRIIQRLDRREVSLESRACRGQTGLGWVGFGFEKNVTQPEPYLFYKIWTQPNPNPNCRF